MTDEDYVKLMKKLNPKVIVSPELIGLFKKDYPPDSAALMQLKMMIAAAPVVKTLRKFTKRV